MIDPNTLKVGDWVAVGWVAHGEIIEIAPAVRIRWAHVEQLDTLSKNSPLWIFLQLERS